MICIEKHCLVYDAHDPCQDENTTQLHFSEKKEKTLLFPKGVVVEILSPEALYKTWHQSEFLKCVIQHRGYKFTEYSWQER